MDVLIDIAGGCVLDEAMLRGYISAGRQMPRPEIARDGDTVRLTFGGELDPGQLGELVRILGGATTGDAPARILAPEAIAGQLVVPAEKPGPARWDCPRCERSVLEHANDVAGAKFGICQACHATEMRMAGLEPNPPSSPAVPATPAAGAAVAPGPAYVVAAGAPEPAHVVAAVSERAPASAAPEVLSGLPIVRAQVVAAPSFAALPPPRVGLFALVGERLLYASATQWHALEGAAFPVL